MKSTVTKQKLFNAHTEIEAIASTGVGILLADQAAKFYKKNGKNITALQSRILELQQKHIVFENGKMVFPERKADDKTPLVPIFKIGSSKEILQAEYEALMNETVEIEI